MSYTEIQNILFLLKSKKELSLFVCFILDEGSVLAQVVTIYVLCMSQYIR